MKHLIVNSNTIIFVPIKTNKDRQTTWILIIHLTSNKMHRFLKFVLILPLLSLAQASDLGNWSIYFGDKKINDKWNWHHEVQYRHFNLVGDTEQLLIRTGLGYNLSENNNNIHLGYAFIYSEPYIGDSDDKRHFNEHRIYQQFITRQSFGRFNIQHRYRFEQRFFSNDFKMRLRYFLAVNMALNNITMANKTLYLTAYNEIFINTESNFFDRNRLFGGLGYRFNKNVRTEIGLMNQLLNDQNSRNQLNIICFYNF